ncbi:MAG: 50S ribosomal protein L22 [Candidatus Yanofskybacteria bacterium GW2011_GWA1_39_13]|uniref:Large ribosomal subunit protein uL22 n=1 Tax=Yanofskybacteria sp. (strain GW2011_GWA1_39_13) TaxID=1619019 RepID=A0A0G0PW18_YANXG|nr:MAG: 50S ribosomal protein L22 [Candidatus Yanofskybacteria bacterium GW2011_GWA1_39_13]
MEVKAQLNGLRMAPRKVRAITNLTKGKDVVHALNQMEFLIKRPVLPLIKLLKSAVANAENNLSMVKENLYIKEFHVDEGIKLKRYMPKAQGRAGEIQKKTSRVRLILDERVAGLKKHTSEKKTKEKAETVADESIKTETRKHEVKTEIGKKSEGSIAKRLFRRKQV